jgi:hypothetical protein
MYIAITKADGSVAVMTLGKRVDPSDDEALAREVETTGLAAAPSAWRRVETDDFPAGASEYFEALRDDGTAITVDLPKARELHRERLRREREPLLEALDVEYQRADEENRPAEKAAVVRAKKALRDVTADPRLEAAQTIDDLLAVELPA